MTCGAALGHSRPFEFRRESAATPKAGNFAMTAKGQQPTLFDDFKNAHTAAVVSFRQAFQQTVGLQAPPPRVSLS
jgi:hypothetical protein